VRDWAVAEDTRSLPAEAAVVHTHRTETVLVGRAQSLVRRGSEDLAGVHWEAH